MQNRLPSKYSGSRDQTEYTHKTLFTEESKIRIDICMESLGQMDLAIEEMRSGQTQAHQEGPSRRIRAKASSGFKNEEASQALSA